MSFFAINSKGQTENTTSATKQIVTAQQWNEMKKAGTITPNATMWDPNAEHPVFHPVISPSSHNASKREKSSNICECFQEIDTSWHVVPVYPGNSTAVAPWWGSDDDASHIIPLPFSFCFYGHNYDSCYINTNGIITFGQPYTVFNPIGLAFDTVKMVAPFWADVENELAPVGGVIYYKMTPTALLVRWDSVGYYSNGITDAGGHHDKLCDFQCIITNGTDPLVPNGNNVKFCYGIMQWTTGDASNDSAGFCGIGGTGFPAVVGASNGNGNSTDYVQFGQFGRPGNAYNTPVDPYPYSGVGWLQNQTFVFSTCTSNNIPPVAQGISYCDTIRMCANDTLFLPVHFLSPEANQITHDTAWSNMTGFQIVSDTTANDAYIGVRIIAYTINYGVNSVTFQAIDNGSPHDTTTITLYIKVDTFTLAQPVISNLHQFICPNAIDTIWVNNPPVYNSYSWNTGATTDTVFVSNGVYKVAVTSPNGCRAWATDTVNVYPGSIPVITGILQHCTGDSSLLNAGNGYISYQWSTGATTQTIYAITGTYSVTVVDSHGCVGASAPVTVVAGNLQPVITGMTHVCSGDSAHLTTSISYFHYHWSNGGTSQINGVLQGSYTVTVSDSSGCTGTASIVVTASQNPTPIISGINHFCGNSGTTLTTQHDSLYNWSSGGTSQTIIAGAGIYIVTVTDSLGCVGTSPPDTVIEHPSPTPVITGGDHICDTGTVTLTTGVFVNYFWSNSSTTETISVSPLTTIIYTVIVTDNNGCTGISPGFTVTVLNPQVTISGNAHNCDTATSIMTATSGYAHYLWNPGGDTINTKRVNNGTYSVTVTDTFGCTATASFHVRQSASPIPAINGDTVYCGTDNVTLTAAPNGMASYTWSNGTLTQSGVFSEGTYYITITDTSGCHGVDSIYIQQHPRPTPVITGDSTFCAYDSTQLSVDSTYSQYLWNNTATTQSITTHTSSIYTVTVTNQWGCTGTSQVFTTDVKNVPLAAFTIYTPIVGRPDTIIHFYDSSFVLSPAVIDSVYWWFGDGDMSTLFNPTHNYQTTGIYIVKMVVVTSDGCRDTIIGDYVIVSSPVIPPNVFTPNGDGLNDVLVFQDLWQYANSRLEIYNRWGLKLYDNANYQNDWNGDNHPDGVYYYILHVADTKGTILHGWMEILRGK